MKKFIVFIKESNLLKCPIGEFDTEEEALDFIAIQDQSKIYSIEIKSDSGSEIIR